MTSAMSWSVDLGLHLEVAVLLFEGQGIQVALAMSWSVDLGLAIALARIPGEFLHLVNGQVSGDHGDSSFLLQSLQGAGIDKFLEDAVQNGIPTVDFTSNHGHFGRIGHFASAELSALLFSSQHALGPQVVCDICFLGLFWGERVVGVGKD